MNDQVFGLWGSDDYFAIGCVHPFSTKSARTAFVVAHVSEDAAWQADKSAVLVDAFRIPKREGFCRVFALPGNTRFVELLRSDGDQATPVKLFKLIQTEGFDFEDCRYRAVQINTGNERDNIAKLGVRERYKAFGWNRKTHIGWAMEYPLRDSGNPKTPYITEISSSELRVPKSGERISIVQDGIHRHTNEIRSEDLKLQAPQIVHRMVDKAPRSLGFLLPGLGREDLVGLHVFILNRHLWAATRWKRDDDYEADSVSATVDHIFNKVFEGIWPRAEDCLVRMLERQNVPEEEIEMERSKLQAALFQPERRIDLAAIKDPLVILEEAERGFGLEIHGTSPGDHVIFCDMRGREIVVDGVKGIDAADGGSDVAPLEVSVNGLKLPERDYRSKNETYINDMRDEAAALPEHKRVARSDYSEALRRYLAQFGLAQSKEDFAPLLAFPLQAAGITGDDLPDGVEALVTDPAASLMALTVGGRAVPGAMSQASGHGSLLRRAMSMRGCPDLMRESTSLVEQMVQADLLLHASRNDIRDCGEILGDITPAEAEFSGLAEKVRQYRQYFEPGHWLSRYAQAERDIVAPGEVLLTPAELEAQLGALQTLERDLEPLRDGASGSVPEQGTADGETEAGYRSRIEHALSAVRVSLQGNPDSRFDRLHALLPRSGNPSIAKDILHQIRIFFPNVTNADDTIIQEVRGALMTWAEIPGETIDRQDLLLLSGEEQEITEEAAQSRNRVESHMAQRMTGNLNGTDDHVRLGHLAVNLTMSVQYGWINEVFEACERSRITVPVELRRRLATWPRNCQTTWSKARNLAADLEGDGEPPSFDPFRPAPAEEAAATPREPVTV